jgi:3-oxoadipate CoA-transferase beta subunit
MTVKLNRNQIAWRVAQDIDNGAYVNLGIGQPELVANYVPEGREVIFHSENGVLGIGPQAAPEDADLDLHNAGVKPVTLLPGGAFFNQVDSFTMIRGRHLDICVLGAFQVSEAGDLANWSTGDLEIIPAVGGAMDLAIGAKQVFVTMSHCARDGTPKIVRSCTYPLTGVRAVKFIYTDLAVIDVTSDGLAVREMVDGIELGELQSHTGAPLRLADGWSRIAAPDL